MSLLEVLVVLAIMGVVLAIGVPSLRAALDVEQRAAARALAQTYQFLMQEAMMRNVSFRVAFNLDERCYTIEVGDPKTLIFATPDAREDYEEEQRHKLKFFTKREIAAGKATEATGETKFASIELPGFDGKVELPRDTALAWAWTPQYKKPVTPSKKRKEDDPPSVAYSHVFPSGYTEYTVVRIVDIEDTRDGYTIEVEPLSGEVRVLAEEVSPGSSQAWIPSEAPQL
jgi:prepilin-type N-terminal cleavage/methylation domain-containing protein